MKIKLILVLTLVFFFNSSATKATDDDFAILLTMKHRLSLAEGEAEQGKLAVEIFTYLKGQFSLEDLLELREGAQIEYFSLMESIVKVTPELAEPILGIIIEWEATDIIQLLPSALDVYRQLLVSINERAPGSESVTAALAAELAMAQQVRKNMIFLGSHQETEVLKEIALFTARVSPEDDLANLIVDSSQKVDNVLAKVAAKCNALDNSQSWRAILIYLTGGGLALEDLNQAPTAETLDELQKKVDSLVNKMLVVAGDGGSVEAVLTMELPRVSQLKLRQMHEGRSLILAVEQLKAARKLRFKK